jgi:uncharacterized membrane protein YkvI
MTAGAPGTGANWFRRFLLPGFAMKGVIIGGGYATGRELAEFFAPAGPWGGIAGMGLAMLIWSLVAAVTFALANRWRVGDYQSFFKQLLGPGWVVFELAYLLFVVLILAVFGAAAGSIGQATFGWPETAGALLLAIAILLTTAFGETAVEQLFQYASFLIYGVYLLFILFAFGSFGDRIGAAFAQAGAPAPGWAVGGITYAGYNIVGAVMILPVLRHLTGTRDAMMAGAIAGPLAMLPALLFFTAMMAFHPAIADEALPSDVLLRAMGVPGFQLLFQLMIFVALLESGVGAVHAINERIDHARAARGHPSPGLRGRLLIGGALLAGCMFVAGRIGLVDLIAGGYRLLAALFLLVYVVPLMTLGVMRLLRSSHADPEVRP